MSLDHLFKAQFVTGQTIKIVTPRNAMLDACEVNIGTLTGKVRSLPTILCDGVDESDPWHVVNLVDEKNMLLDHIAIKGAVSPGQAERLCHKYMPQMANGHIRNIVTMTDNGMKTFIDSASLPNNTPFVLDADALMLDSMTTTTAVQWSEDNKLLSHGGRMSGVMYDMACCDTQGDLVESVTPRDIASLLIDEHCSFGGMLDAMVIKKYQFDGTMQKIAEALKAYDNEDLFVKSVTSIEPFKRNGVVNVGAIFTMSDLQTITVLFNNPDSTPAKLTNDDVLTSWKWMLNKRDVTATLQPRAVESKKFPMIAGRIIRLLARNHDRFKRAQMLREKDMLLLNELIDQVEAKQSQVRSADAQILQVQSDIDAETVRKQNQTEIGKADLTTEGAEKFYEDLKEVLDQNEQIVQMNNESAIIQKATDLNNHLISSHGFSVDTLASQGEHTFNLITANGAHLAIFTFIDETANGVWTLGLSSGGEVKNLADIDTRQSIEAIAQSIVDIDKQNVQMNNIEVAEGFSLVEIESNKHWKLTRENVDWDVDINFKGEKYQSSHGGITSMPFDSMDKALTWGYTLLNERMNAKPEPKKGVVFKKEAESVYRSIDYSVLDYHGHTSDEFKRAKVKERLEPKIAEAEALLTRRFRDEFQRQQVEQSIKNAKSMIERWESKQVAPQPQPQPEPIVSEAEQFLNDIINGTADMSDEAFSDKLLALAENLDPSLEDLFEQASDAYADYAISLEV